MKLSHTVWIFFSMILIGCGDNDFSDLDAFIDNRNVVSTNAIKPIPKLRPYKKFAYRAAQIRSPFSLPPDPNGISRTSSTISKPPDETRQREFLEQFPLESLSMVGSLNRSNKIWCLVLDPSGGVHLVSNGSFIGLNHGKVVSATDTSIKVIEIVTDGTESGWIERPRSLNLNSF